LTARALTQISNYGCCHNYGRSGGATGSSIALRCCSGLEQTMKLNVIILFPKSSNYAEVTCHYASVYRSVKINTKNLTAGLIDIILNHNLLCSLLHI